MRTQARDLIFDSRGSVPPPSWGRFVAEHVAVLTDNRRFRTESQNSTYVRGDGHPVIVLPGFLCGDAMTAPFRRLLAALGYAATGWGAGINLGPTATVLAGAEALLRHVAERSGERASLVGQSLGGVLARALASGHPERVRRVVTVCSPFRLPTASKLAPIYRSLAPLHRAQDAMLCRLAVPPPVPTTAIYTPRDGIVAWTSCIDEPGPGRENVAIDGAHTTMLGNPRAIRVITERLALPEIRDCRGGFRGLKEWD